MSKGLEALEMMDATVDVMCGTEYNEAKKIVEKELKALAIIEENLKYGYVFVGYDKDKKPLFKFADTKLYEAIDKLGRLEDVEQKLGIDLDTLFKVVTDGCYYRRFKGIFHFKPDTRNFTSLNLENKSIDLMYVDEYSMYVLANLMLNGYGTEWALTEEELE